MIEKAYIKNFQSWREVSLSFHPGVNVFAGESDRGKSALIRALEKNITNRPRGTRFVSHFAEDDTVIIIYYTGEQFVSRVVGKEQYYETNSGTFKAVGADMPSEVYDVSHCTEENIQDQFVPYFLLSETPGKIAKRFNKLADLTVMDESLSKATSAITQYEAEETKLKKEIEELEWAVESLDWLEDAEKQYKKALELQAQIEVSKLKRGRIARAVEGIVEARKELEQIEEKLKAEDTLISAEHLLTEHKKTSQKRKGLERIADSIRNAQSDIKKLEKLFKADKPLQEAEKLLAGIEENRNRRLRINRLVSSMKTLQQEITDLDYENKEKEYNNLLKELGYCPLCGNKIKGKK